MPEKHCSYSNFLVELTMKPPNGFKISMRRDGKMIVAKMTCPIIDSDEVTLGTISMFCASDQERYAAWAKLIAEMARDMVIHVVKENGQDASIVGDVIEVKKHEMN